MVIDSAQPGPVHTSVECRWDRCGLLRVVPGGAGVVEIREGLRPDAPKAGLRRPKSETEIQIPAHVSELN